MALVTGASRGIGSAIALGLAAAGALVGGAVGVHDNASKAGLEGLTRGYAVQLARDGVTDARAGRAHQGPGAGTHPGGPHRHSDAMALGVLSLIADGFITGQSLQINGGSHPA